MDTFRLLQKIPAFATLTDEQLALLSTRVGTQHFDRGATIFDQGSTGNMLYIIVEGQVRIYTVSETGQELSVMIFHEGDFFGELSLLDGQPRSASAVAMRPTKTLTLHRSGFLDLLSACPPVAVVVLEALAARLRSTNSYAEHLASQPASQRVVRQLLDLALRYGIRDANLTQIDLRLTQDDLASLAGTTRETVNRVLANLRDRGLIRVQRGRVSVLSLEQLEQSLIQF